MTTTPDTAPAATDPGTAPPGRPNGPAAVLLDLRRSTAARVAMRRGASPATEHYAYPYLSPLWTARDEGQRRWDKQAVLLAGHAAAVSSTRHDSTRLGEYLRRAALADDAVDRIGRRIVNAQTGDLRKLHRVVVHHLAANPHRGGVDWDDLWWTYQLWDQPDRERRTSRRRRLLEDFYRPLPKATKAGEGTDTTSTNTPE